MNGPTILPDGSAIALASYPLPKDHWLYAPRVYREGEVEPAELPAPVFERGQHAAVLTAAARYAIRAATMCGQETDFDPDALVQNLLYALCGPANGLVVSDPADEFAGMPNEAYFGLMTPAPVDVSPAPSPRCWRGQPCDCTSYCGDDKA